MRFELKAALEVSNAHNDDDADGTPPCLGYEIEIRESRCIHVQCQAHFNSRMGSRKIGLGAVEEGQ